MPFWTAVRKCLHCMYWRPADPSAILSDCEAKPERPPFWLHTDPTPTRFDEGTTCPAYVHDKRKPHPLDRSPGIIVGLAKDDVIQLRTYTPGTALSTTKAEVIRVGRDHVTIRMFNAEYRMRVRSTERERAGTVVGMEDWGIDTVAPIQRAGRPMHDMRRAPELLAKVRVGDKVPLVGYPPFDGMTKQAHVLRAGRDELVLRCGHGPKLYMHRRGPMAGLVSNDPLWILDVNHAEQTPAAD